MGTFTFSALTFFLIYKEYGIIKNNNGKIKKKVLDTQCLYRLLVTEIQAFSIYPS